MLPHHYGFSLETENKYFLLKQILFELYHVFFCVQSVPHVILFLLAVPLTFHTFSLLTHILSLSRVVDNLLDLSS